MKFNFVISGYNYDDNAIKLFEYDDLKEEKVRELANYVLDNPSYVTSFDKTIFTYTKNPLFMVAFDICDENFKELDGIRIETESMTHLTFSKNNNCLYGASYKDGCICRIDYCEGRFGDLKFVNHKELYGDVSKCHAIIMNSDETIVCVVNIATDSLYFYDVDLNLIKIIKLKDGVGPRHAIWIKNKIYVVTEYSNELIVIDYDKEAIQYVSTLNSDVKSYGATLFYKDGYIYASNRGEETIARFKVKEDGKVEYVNNFSVNGIHPRHMVEYNNLVISCNKNSNNVSIIDLSNDKEVCSFEFPNPSGVCIVK